MGIDEAGRGPLAGPVAVGVALVREDFDWDLIPGVNDSKQLKEKDREAIFLLAKQLKKEGRLDYAVSMVSAKVIDKKGIVYTVDLAMGRAIKRIEDNLRSRGPTSTSRYEKIVVKLDGGLKAPEKFIYQETIIKGDSKEKVIGLASIMAKVTRDRYMTRRAKLAAYQPYNFAQHKGYGTKKHREAILKYGLSDLHRASYCKNLIQL